ncbi:MAG: DUF885 family protein [Acidobacteria bacterium]|nr:DUF885 family protein [Acidobacteriota bacterium]
MNKRAVLVFVAAFSLATLAWAAYSDRSPVGAQAPATYEALTALYTEMRESQRVTPEAGVPDYSPAAVAARRQNLDEFGRRLDAFDSSKWSRSQRVDHALVLAQWRLHDFEHRVMKPWARDAGLYVDMVGRVPFAALPLKGDALAQFRTQLAAVPRVLEQARANLTEGAGEQARLALYNLENADGVGHGHPYRPVPPPGVIGWYDDLATEMAKHHPELVDEVKTVRQSVAGFRDWLKANAGPMNAPAGIGLDNYDYLQRYIRLMPFTGEDNIRLGERELERSRAFLALERWKNRGLPELTLPTSAQEYQKRIDDADQLVRRFIVEKNILTIPDYIRELDTNVPWIVRPGGLNFWEAIQFRDPLPDHVHAVIPGHRFDGAVKRQDKRPIRGTYSDGGRSEGWAFYLEEMFLQAGLLEDRPRTKELFYLFQIKRATRNKAEVLMHANEFSVADAVTSMMDNVEYLDEDVARVDAEIYLRRPAYGSGYQMGKLQMDQLLSDRYQQLDKTFDLKQFHDEFLAAGTIPISLIRYEMTGLDNEIGDFFTRVPAPGAATSTRR